MRARWRRRPFRSKRIGNPHVRQLLVGIGGNLAPLASHVDVADAELCLIGKMKQPEGALIGRFDGAFKNGLTVQNYLRDVPPQRQFEMIPCSLDERKRRGTPLVVWFVNEVVWRNFRLVVLSIGDNTL